MSTAEERAKEIERERSRPDGLVVVTLAELENMTTTLSQPTVAIRYLDGVLQQQFRVETISGRGALVGVKHEWCDVPHETVKPHED